MLMSAPVPCFLRFLFFSVSFITSAAGVQAAANAGTKSAEPALLDVQLGRSTPFAFKTAPNATCVLDNGNPASRMLYYSGPLGEIRGDVGTVRSIPKIQQIVFRCSAAGRPLPSIPIVLRTLPGRAVARPQLGFQTITTTQLASAEKRYGFDFTTASQSVLAAHDLPYRPNKASENYQGWLRAVVSPTTMIIRKGQVIDVIHGGPGRTVTVPVDSSKPGHSKLPAGTVKRSVASQFWAGYQGLGYQGTFGIVSGEWRIPSVEPPPYFGGYLYHSALWVGLDGGDCSVPGYPCNVNIFQNGSEQDETSDTQGHYYGSYYIWHQWYPHYSSVFAANANAGDDVYCQTGKYINTYVYAEYWCKDNNNGVLAKSDEVGNAMTNSTAEWIMEAVQGGGTLYPLTKFATAEMVGVYTETTTSVWFDYEAIYPHWNLFNIEILENGHRWAHAFSVDNTTIGYQYDASF